MKHYTCDRCDQPIDTKSNPMNLVRIEIHGQRYDSCTRSECINAFNDFQMRVDEMARASVANLRRFINQEEERFWKGGNPIGEPQETAVGQ